MSHPLCAVLDCPKPGKPQVCPYDHRLHHHGRIHYDCGYPQHSIKFRDDGEWHLVCDEHYAILNAERRTFEKDCLARGWHLAVAPDLLEAS